LQDLLNATSFKKSAAVDQVVMVDGNASGISAAKPASPRNTSAVQSTGFIAGAVISAVMALAVLVAFLIFKHRKHKASNTAQPPEKIIVRLGSESCYEVPQRNLFALLSADVWFCN
jgi:hypothetical protein